MSLGRDRPVAHGSGAESFDDFAGRFDFFDWHRNSVAEFQQATQMAITGRLFVDRVRKSLVGFRIAGPSSGLNVSDVQRRPSMLLSTVTPVDCAGGFQFGSADVLSCLIRTEAKLVTTNRLGSQYLKVNAFDPTSGARKRFLDHRTVESNGFENSGSLVTGESRDAHFGEHFEHAFGHTFAISGNALFGVKVRVRIVFVMFDDGFQAKIRVDRIGTETGQQAMVVNLSGFARFDHNPNPCPQFLLN